MHTTSSSLEQGWDKNVMEDQNTYAGDSSYRRVAALEAKQNQLQDPQKGLVKSQSQMDSKYRGLSKEDRALAERLEKLKKESKSSEFSYTFFLPKVILNRVQNMKAGCLMNSQPCFYEYEEKS